MTDNFSKMDKDTLLTLFQQGLSDNEQLRKLLEQEREDKKQLIEMIQSLQSQLDKLQRMLFGQSSERQRSLKKEITNNQVEQKKIARAQSNNSEANKNGRRQLPETLPRKIVKHDFPEDRKYCSQCECKLQCIGKDISEQLEFVPAQLVVIEHRRYKYSCRCRTVHMAPIPEQPIEKGLAGPGLLAETLIAKYQDHLPLHRQEQRYTRLGYSIARSTLCDWVGQCAFLLKPIVEAMHTDMLLRSPKIHSDDTSIPVLNRLKTHSGRLWVYIGGGRSSPLSVVYRYSKTRSGNEPQNYLHGYQGYLQADAYAGYDKCFLSGMIIEVACMAHARRKIVDASLTVKNDALALETLSRINELYEIEAKVRQMTDRRRYYYRRRYAKPKLKKLYRWLVDTQSQAPPKSPLGMAINYMLNHWQALVNYLRDGVLSIDNNIAERAMRSVVLGRKNYLFAGSHQGAENAAIIYSLIETCKAHEINTFDYLTDVLKRLPSTLNSDIATLLPYNWKPSNQK